MQSAMQPPPTIFTLGHGSRELRELIDILVTGGIRTLADVRAHPASRRHPQFDRASLEQALAAAGIGYRWMGAMLGGMRKARPGSLHVALPDPGFRGFADHMGTEGFSLAAAEIVEVGRTRAVALMCAERLPEHCHRSLIADYLAARGCRVLHLLARGESVSHAMRAQARIDSSGCLVYDRSAQGGLDF